MAKKITFSKTKLAANKELVPSCVVVRCAVYFLWDGDEMVYVGSTVDPIILRLLEHWKHKVFDSYSWVEAPNEYVMREWEMRYELHFRPKYNCAMHVNRRRRELGEEPRRAPNWKPKFWHEIRGDGKYARYVADEKGNKIFLGTVDKLEEGASR